jgi:hypothetical protein
MSKEQIIDEAYKNYRNYPLATRHDHRTNILYRNMHKGWCMLNGRSMASPHPTRHLTQEEFINKCKTDSDFAEKWGLQIEERELSLEERSFLAQSNHYEVSQNIKMFTGIDEDHTLHKNLDNNNVPTRLITITYNNETSEVYE